MKKLIYLLLVTLITTTTSFSQNEELHEARIIGSFELGNKQVTTIYDEVTGCERKTSPHTKNLFTPNENVQIKISDNKQMAEVIKPTLPEQVYINSRCKNNGEVVNPYDYVGERLYSMLEYIENYQIQNPTKTEVLALIKQYATENSLPIVSDTALSQIYDFDGSLALEKLDNMAVNGEISSAFREKISNFHQKLSNVKSTMGVLEIARSSEVEFLKLHSELSENELQFLLSMVSGVKYTAQYMIDNGNTTLPVDAEINAMPCPAATGLYAASFVGLCIATGPIGWAVGIVSFAGGVWGVFDSCK